MLQNVLEISTKYNRAQSVNDYFQLGDQEAENREVSQKGSWLNWVTHLILTTSLGGGYYFHRLEKEADSVKSCDLSKQSWALNPGPQRFMLYYTYTKYTQVLNYRYTAELQSPVLVLSWYLPLVPFPLGYLSSFGGRG